VGHILVGEANDGLTFVLISATGQLNDINAIIRDLQKIVLASRCILKFFYLY
jgi:exopolysaccharide biosynthesis protein